MAHGQARETHMVLLPRAAQSEGRLHLGGVARAERGVTKDDRDTMS